MPEKLACLEAVAKIGDSKVHILLSEIWKLRYINSTILLTDAARVDDGEEVQMMSLPLRGTIACLMATAACCYGQLQMSGSPRLINTDMAVLEAGEVRKDLPCSVTPSKPALGFDLKFHSGYDVSVPLKELAGSENLLTVLFRVTPDNRKDYPVYFTQKIRVPNLDEEARGDAYLQGYFDVGEGGYHVDLLMRDRAERVCSFYWDHEASLIGKDKQIEMVLQPGVVVGSELELATGEVRFFDGTPL